MLRHRQHPPPASITAKARRLRPTGWSGRGGTTGRLHPARVVHPAVLVAHIRTTVFYRSENITDANTLFLHITREKEEDDERKKRDNRQEKEQNGVELFEQASDGVDRPRRRYSRRLCRPYPRQLRSTAPTPPSPKKEKQNSDNQKRARAPRASSKNKRVRPTAVLHQVCSESGWDGAAGDRRRRGGAGRGHPVVRGLGEVEGRHGGRTATAAGVLQKLGLHKINTKLGMASNPDRLPTF